MSLWLGILGGQITAVPISVEYLVIGGGGGGESGGFQAGWGGGGAGGYRTNVSGQTSGGGSSAEVLLTLLLNVQYPVTIGAGGSYTRGNNTTFHNIISLGGGGFSNASGQVGSGAGRFVGTPGQGTDGGSPVAMGGPGGGGAGSAGSPSNSLNGANGGNGLSSNITGTAVTRAGGGGGAPSPAGGSVSGLGGTGGGGSLGPPTDVAGSVNTGSGGSPGGSGIIIIRIPNTFTATFTAGVSQTMSTAVAGSKVYTITAAGTNDRVTFS